MTALGRADTVLLGEFPLIGTIRTRRGTASHRGQAVVELVLLIPLLVVILLGTAEVGIGFMHHLTVEGATLEGARVGAALLSGTGACTPADPVDGDVDNRVIAAVQRVLTSPSSLVDPSDVYEIRIYRADASAKDGATEGANVNVWVPGTGPEPAVEGVPLLFTRDLARQGWDACLRHGDADPNAIGVSVTYEYQTVLGNVFSAVGVVQVQITDRTVMELGPS